MKDQSRNKQNRDWGWEDGETFKIHTDKPLADQAKRKKKKPKNKYKAHKKGTTIH